MGTQPKTPASRSLALQVIEHTLQGQDLQSALSQALSRYAQDAQDRRLITHLAYGYFRTKIRLDFILGHFLGKRSTPLPRGMHLALTLGIYELCWMSRIPAYASVNWYVQRIKKRFSQQMGGLANAVLRNVARNASDLMTPSFYTQDAPPERIFLSRYFACPQWVVDLVSAAYTPEQARFMLQRSLHPPPVGLRFPPASQPGMQLMHHLRSSQKVIARTSHALALEQIPVQEVQEAEQIGLVTRQSLAAQRALLHFEPRTWPVPLWDACAGRGLKTGHLLELGCTELWASDIHGLKVRTCRSELGRLGHFPIPLFVANACVPPVRPERPGTILLDVPCSGLGVLSRRPDIKAKRREQDLLGLINLQKIMLTSCLALLPPGGRLIYITCTVNPAENEELISSALSSCTGHILDMVSPRLESSLGEYFFTACIQK